MSRTAISPASKTPASAKPNLENHYKPVGIAAINAATVCKGSNRPTKNGKK